MSCSLVDEAIVLRCMGSLCFAAGLQGKVCVTKHTSIFLMEKGYRDRKSFHVSTQRSSGLGSQHKSVAIFQFCSEDSCL